jgi:hypothetical protein
MPYVDELPASTGCEVGVKPNLQYPFEIKPGMEPLVPLVAFAIILCIGALCGGGGRKR